MDDVNIHGTLHCVLLCVVYLASSLSCKCPWAVVVMLSLTPNPDNYSSGPGCSKLMTSLVNVSLKFQTLLSHISQYLLLKKCEKLLQYKSSSQLFNKSNSVNLVIKL